MNNKLFKRPFPRILYLSIIGAILNCPLYSQLDEELFDEDVYELSPFVVDSENDSDYRAQNTLAGTRIKSSLKDVSASLSVMTNVFLEDIGASDAQDAMLYSVSVENEDEYVADDTEGFANADTTSTRVRGMTTASNSRNFNKTYLNADVYNTNSITVSRGANSILFGIGSPAGSLDASYKMAMFDDEYSFSFKTDDHGSQRFVWDLNKKINDNFAIRLIGLDQEEKSFMEPEFDDEKRLFVTATYTPFERTTIRAYYEKMEDYRVRGRRMMPKDGISAWIEAGRPMYDNLNGVWLDQSGSAVDVSSYNFKDVSANTRYIFSNGISTSPSDGLPFGNQAQRFGKSSVSGNDSFIRSFENEDIIPADRNVYGEANWAEIEAEVASFAVEQAVGDNLFFEVAYNKEMWENHSAENIRPGMPDSAVQADVNLYLVDKDGNAIDTPNPNAGRYFVEAFLIGFDREKDLETFRTTASYSLDLTEKSGWLGSHNFSALYQVENEENIHIKTRVKNITGSPTDPGFGYDPAQDLFNRAYIDLGGSISDGSGVFSAKKWKTPIENGHSYWPVALGSIGEGPIHEESEITSTMGVVQSRWELTSNPNDELIVTYGIRSDDFKRTSADFSSITRDEIGLFEWEEVPVDNLVAEGSGTTSSLGLVYHTPIEGLSLLYNVSDNFTPQAGWFDYNYNPISASTGETTDYGISYEALEGRFYAKLVRFEAESRNGVEHDWFYWSANWWVISQMESQVDQWVDIYADRGIDRSEDLSSNAEIGGKQWYWNVDSMRPVRNRSTEGYEFELFYQPTKNWNIRLTAAQNESIDSNIAPGLKSFIDSRWEVYERYKGLTRPVLISGSSDAEVLAGTYDDAIAYSEYMGSPNADIYSNPNSVAFGPWWVPVYRHPEAVPRVEELRSLDGQPTQRSRKYRVNLTTNYDFTEGRLKNFGVGAAMRYRSAASIGNYGTPSTNPTLPDDTLVADVTRPINGDEVLEFDFWSSYWKPLQFAGTEVVWSISLNVRNAFSDGGLEPGAVDFDGNPTVMLIKPPRTFYLTTGLKF